MPTYEKLPFLSDDFCAFLETATRNNLFTTHPEIENIINIGIQQARQNQHDERCAGKTYPTSQLEMDLYMMHSMASVFGNIVRAGATKQDTPQLFEQFRKFSSAIATNYGQLLQDTSEHLRGKTPSLVTICDEFAQKNHFLQGAIQALSLGKIDTVQHLQNIMQTIEEISPQSLQQRINSEDHCIEIHLAAQSYLEESRKLLPEYNEFEERLKLAIQASDAHISQLLEELHRTGGTGNEQNRAQLHEDLWQAQTRRAQLENEEKQYIRRKIEIENEKNRQVITHKIMGIKNGCTLISMISNISCELIGNRFPQAVPYLQGAAKVAAVGSAITDIAINIVNWTAISAASGPLAPVVGIFGAFQVLVGLWNGNQPSDREVILGAMRELSGQMTHVEEITKQGFKATLETLQLIDSRTQERFNNLEQLIIAGYREIFENFKDIKKDLSTLNNRISDVLNKLDEIHDEFRISHTEHREQFEQDYIIFANKVAEFCRNPQVELDSSQIAKYLSRFQTHAIEDATSEILAGPSTTVQTAPETIVTWLHNRTISQNINLLRYFASTMLDNVCKDRLVNPEIWASTTLRLIDFLINTPNANLFLCSDSLQAIFSQGQKVQQFVLQLKTSPQLLLRLLSNYEQSLQQVKTAMKDIIISTGRFSDFAALKGAVAVRWSLHAQLELIRAKIAEKQFSLIGITNDIASRTRELERKTTELQRKQTELTEKSGAHDKISTKDTSLVVSVARSFGEALLFQLPVVGPFVVVANGTIHHNERMAAQKRFDDILQLSKQIDALNKEIVVDEYTASAYRDARNHTLAEIENLQRILANMQPLVDEAEKKEENAVFCDYIQMLFSPNNEEGYRALLNQIGVHAKTTNSALYRSLINLDIHHCVLLSFLSLLFSENTALQNQCHLLLGTESFIGQITALQAEQFDPDKSPKSFMNFYQQQKTMENLEIFRKTLLTATLECEAQQKNGEKITSYPILDIAMRNLQKMLLIAPIDRQQVEAAPPPPKVRCFASTSESAPGLSDTMDLSAKEDAQLNEARTASAREALANGARPLKIAQNLMEDVAREAAVKNRKIHMSSFSQNRTALESAPNSATFFRSPSNTQATQSSSSSSSSLESDAAKQQSQCCVQ